MTLTLKSDKEKSTNSADLVQENSFSPTYFLRLFRLVKKGGKAVHLLEKSVISMNRPVLPVLDWPFTMIRWFAISISHLFAGPLSVL